MNWMGQRRNSCEGFVRKPLGMRLVGRLLDGNITLVLMLGKQVVKMQHG